MERQEKAGPARTMVLVPVERAAAWRRRAWRHTVTAALQGTAVIGVEPAGADDTYRSAGARGKDGVSLRGGRTQIPATACGLGAHGDDVTEQPAAARGCRHRGRCRRSSAAMWFLLLPCQVVDAERRGPWPPMLAGARCGMKARGRRGLVGRKHRPDDFGIPAPDRAATQNPRPAGASPPAMDEPAQGRTACNRRGQRGGE